MLKVSIEIQIKSKNCAFCVENILNMLNVMKHI